MNTVTVSMPIDTYNDLVKAKKTLDELISDPSKWCVVLEYPHRPVLFPVSEKCAEIIGSFKSVMEKHGIQQHYPEQLA